MDGEFLSAKVTDAWLVNAQQKNSDYLLALEPERLLYEWYRVAQMQPKTTSGYAGWERSNEVNFRGHFFGHYLSALALMAESVATDAERSVYLKRVAACVNELRAIQLCYGQLHPDSYGYVCAFGEAAFDQVEGKVVALEKQENVLVPWYNLHKLVAGLVDSYTVLLQWNPETAAVALAIVSDLGKYIYQRTQRLTQPEKLLEVEYGGMNDALYRLFQVTNNPHHAAAAHAFDEVRLFQKLAAGVDCLAGHHANTMIPKLLGALQAVRSFEEMPEAQQERYPWAAMMPDYLAAVENFWAFVVNHHSYATGGNSQSEHFHEAGELYHDAFECAGDCTCETCNTHNLLKLTRLLWERMKEAHYADFYERTYINAILPSQHPETGMLMYFQPMGMGYNKVFSQPFTDFWCCMGTGIESFAKLGDSLIYQEADELYVLLYFSNRAALKNQAGWVVQTTTRQIFTTEIYIEGDKGKSWRIHLRIPPWRRPSQ